MGAIIIGFSYKNKIRRKHYTESHNLIQFEERRASDGSIFDAALTGDNVAR